MKNNNLFKRKKNIDRDLTERTEDISQTASEEKSTEQLPTQDAEVGNTHSGGGIPDELFSDASRAADMGIPDELFNTEFDGNVAEALTVGDAPTDAEQFMREAEESLEALKDIETFKAINSIEALDEPDSPEELEALAAIRLLDESTPSNTANELKKPKKSKKNKKNKKANSASASGNGSEAPAVAADVVGVGLAADAAETAIEAAAKVAVEAEGATDSPKKAADALPSSDNIKPKRVRKTGTPSLTPRIIVTLTVICVLIASLLGVVNAVTKQKIADNTERSKEISILAIFEYGTSCELYEKDDAGKEVYLVYRGDDIIGYSVFVTSTGFGGEIEMIVGIDSEYKTAGVQIVTMSETPGVGTKTKTPDFLNGLIGKSHDAPTDGVDVISGATISSNAVLAGVVSAHEVTLDLAAIAEEKGVRLLSPTELEGEEITSPESEPFENTTVSTDADTAVTDTTPTPDESTDIETTLPVETEDLPNKDNGDGKYYVYSVDVETADDKYVLEIKKEDETATAEETETEEPEEVTTEPEETEPETTKPKETEPETTKSKETEPVTTKPKDTDPETTKPKESEPETTESETTEPEITESEATESETAEPETTEPETDPVSPDTSPAAEAEEPEESTYAYQKIFPYL